ncbi:MAG: hypothetical protein IID28_05865 [Planctomycetes bacterium]|nr:hypothetical protein [Planctomycetota bacterium]
MKVKTMALAAGVCTPLILSGSASGGFVGITTTSKPNDFGLLVVNVYAVFDRPGEDSMISVAGTPMNPLHIVVENGTFYNSAFGNDRAPDPALIDVYPSLAFDTFVSIGKKVSTGDTLIITPGFPVGITGSSLWMDMAGWALFPNSPQGNPFDPANSFPGNGQILIAQFSTADGTAIHGTLRIRGMSNGIEFVSIESFFQVPGPGAYALFGLAGLLRVRRRRRQPPKVQPRHTSSPRSP